MVLTEFDEEVFRNGMIKEGYDKGLAEGALEANRSLIMKLLKKGKTVQEISDLCDFPYDLVNSVAEATEEKI